MKILKIAMTKTVQSNYAIRFHGLVNCSHGLVIRSLELAIDNPFSRIAIHSLEFENSFSWITIRSLELDNLIRENDLFKMDELKSERTNCLNRRNELIIRENGFSIRGNGFSIRGNGLHNSI